MSKRVTMEAREFRQMKVIVAQSPWKSPATKTEQVAVGTTVPVTCILSVCRHETGKSMKRMAFFIQSLRIA